MIDSPFLSNLRFSVMERMETCQFTLLDSHYSWKIPFVFWLFTSGTPTERTNYGLLH